jgi:hypothetical protein
MRGCHAWLNTNPLTLLKLLGCSRISMASFTNLSMHSVLLARMVASSKPIFDRVLCNVPRQQISPVGFVVCDVHFLCTCLLWCALSVLQTPCHTHTRCGRCPAHCTLNFLSPTLTNCPFLYRPVYRLNVFC